MLVIVEHEQQCAVAQRCNELIDAQTRTADLEAKRRGDRQWNILGHGDRRKPDDRRAVRE